MVKKSVLKMLSPTKIRVQKNLIPPKIIWNLTKMGYNILVKKYFGPEKISSEIVGWNLEIFGSKKFGSDKCCVQKKFCVQKLNFG